MRLSNLLGSGLALLALSTNDACAYLQSGCANQQYSASQVSQAIQNSPNANSTLKSSSCNFGGAAIAESGGNTCASNGNNFGVLQLTSSNLPAGMSANQYSEPALATTGQHLGATGRQFQHVRRLSDARQQQLDRRRSGDAGNDVGLLPIRSGNLQKRCRLYAGQWRRVSLRRQRRRSGDRFNALEWHSKSRRQQPKHLLLGSSNSKQDQPGGGHLQQQRRHELPGWNDHAWRRDFAIAEQCAALAPRQCRMIAPAMRPFRNSRAFALAIIVFASMTSAPFHNRRAVRAQTADIRHSAFRRRFETGDTLAPSGRDLSPLRGAVLYSRHEFHQCDRRESRLRRSVFGLFRRIDPRLEAPLYRHRPLGRAATDLCSLRRPYRQDDA